VHELLARISATAGASGPASGSLNGGLDQAEGDPEADPQGALCSPPPRNGHNGSRAVNSARDPRRNDPPQASRSRVPPRSMQNQPQDARGCRKVPPNALGPRRETGVLAQGVLASFGNPNNPHLVRLHPTKLDLKPPTIHEGLNDDFAIFSYSRIEALQRLVNHQLHDSGYGELAAVSTPNDFVSRCHRNTRLIGSVENQFEIADR